VGLFAGGTMPQDLNTDPIAAIWTQLLGLPNNGEPVEPEAIKTALKRLLDNSVQAGRKFKFNWDFENVPFESGTNAAYVGAFNLLLTGNQRLRLVRALWNTTAVSGYNLLIGWAGTSNSLPITGPAGLTRYTNGAAKRSSIAPINHYLNAAGTPNFSGNDLVTVAVVTDNPALTSNVLPFGRVMVEFEVVD
jgi:hypothetical protein